MSRESKPSQTVVPRPALGASLVREAPSSLHSQPTALSVDTAVWRPIDTDYAASRVDRWEKFETEFGIAEPEHSPVFRSVQAAKYNLDRLVFAASEFSRNLSDVTDFELDHGRLYHVSAAGTQVWEEPSSSSAPIPRNVHLGLDVNVAQGKPYVGVKLVIPFGN
jgi:hypothetical protein